MAASTPDESGARRGAMSETSAFPTVPGPASVRRVAANLVDMVLGKGRALDDALADPKSGFRDLADRDRAYVRRLAATTLGSGGAGHG